MSDLGAALTVAIRVHADQRDQQGEPYLLHVLRVVEAVSSDAKVVAALHDAFEDGEDALEDCTLPLTVAEREALDLLDNYRDETYANYVGRIAHVRNRCAHLAREVKIADLRDNLGRIPPEPPRILTNPLTAKTYGEWRADWRALKARYEKALATLEAPVGDQGERS